MPACPRSGLPAGGRTPWPPTGRIPTLPPPPVWSSTRGSIDSQSRSAQDSRPARPSPEYIYSGKATREKDVSSPSDCSSSRSSWGIGQSAETCSLGMSQIGSEAFTLRGTCSPPPSTPPCSPPSPSASSTRRLYGCCSLAWHAATRTRASDGRAWWTP